MSPPFPLAILAAPAGEAATGVRESLRLLDLPPSWVIVLLILPLFGLVTWIGYARETLRTPWRALLSALRLAAFLLLFLVLSRPVRVERREEVQPAEVIVLLDDSASMSRTDGYAGDEAARRALREAVGADPAGATRLELARHALEKTILPRLAKGGYVARLFAFAAAPTPLSRPADATGRGGATHLGDAVTRVLASHRGRPVSDVIVLSDGRSNGGLDVAEAARTAGTVGIPVHTVVIGDTRPEKNVVLELVEAPTDALEDDELAVTVRVLGRGTADLAPVDVILEEVDPETGEVRRTIATQTVPLTAAGERIALVAPSEQASLRTGDRRFRVHVPPLHGETMVDDNQVEFSVHVAPVQIRLLYVEGRPRYEYRFMKEIFRRADPEKDRRADVSIQCWLVSADRDFPQDSSPGLPSLRELPTTREELLASYDVVILGDLNPFTISPDPQVGEAFLRALREFVEAGGGLLFQAGEFDNPRAYLQTPLEDVLPVVLDPTGSLSYQGDRTEMFRPVLEDPGHPHEILRLDPDPAANRRLWESAAEGLSGFYWYSPVRRAKPGTAVLLRHPRDRTPQDGELQPLLVLGHFPAGRTIFLGVDETWRWRWKYENRYLAPFWRHAVRWLALGRLKSSDRRHRLEATRTAYDLEERIVLEARVLDADFRPATEPSRTARWAGPDGRTRELELVLAENRPGVYRGGLQMERPGLYRAWIEAGGERVATAEFEVRLPSHEAADPSPDPEALALLARKTGGRALSLVKIGALADELPGGEERREPISSRLEDAWDRGSTLLLALGLLAAEWILRKRVELV
ncbi:MAG: hypothetical protein AB1726_10475 [Planctomycetota bacterium]